MYEEKLFFHVFYRYELQWRTHASVSPKLLNVTVLPLLSQPPRHCLRLRSRVACAHLTPGASKRACMCSPRPTDGRQSEACEPYIVPQSRSFRVLVVSAIPSFVFRTARGLSLASTLSFLAPSHSSSEPRLTLDPWS
jgi:hypothetical protein